jgi:hypothetical protein
VRTGYDSANAASVPEGGDIYLGYIDGSYQSYPGLVKRFPGKLVVPISVNPASNVGLVFDGPPDNATWPQVVGWVDRRRAHGADPTVYCSLSQWTVGQGAFRAAGVAYPHWWIAQWNGVPQLIPSTIGKQYLSVSNRYDTSVFADYWPGVDPAPAPAPPTTTTPAAPAATGDDDMAFMIAVTPDPTNPAGGGAGLFLVSGALVSHIPDEASVAGFQKAGILTAAVTAATYQAMVSASAGLQGALSGSLTVGGTLNVGTPGA